MERGCPQGLVLGLLLWNIFQNDLSYNLDSGLSMYTDDHQIYVKGKDVYYEHILLPRMINTSICQVSQK